MEKFTKRNLKKKAKATKKKEQKEKREEDFHENLGILLKVMTENQQNVQSQNRQQNEQNTVVAAPRASNESAVAGLRKLADFIDDVEDTCGTGLSSDFTAEHYTKAKMCVVGKNKLALLDQFERLSEKYDIVIEKELIFSKLYPYVLSFQD